ncbi:hypothetical protein VCRA2120O62_50001 [Vibrio crassostreae]|nr:hypothetical protein VCRA2120O62_50001 [Vibrio crassostreae]
MYSLNSVSKTSGADQSFSQNFLANPFTSAIVTLDFMLQALRIGDLEPHSSVIALSSAWRIAAC